MVLPDDEDKPAHGFKLFSVKPVPFHVPLEFPLPESDVGLWKLNAMGGAPVPEAPVNKDGDLCVAIYEIRPSREVVSNQSLAQML